MLFHLVIWLNTLLEAAARKIMADTGDQEQLMFYEPFFREQEMLVWKSGLKTIIAKELKQYKAPGY